MYKILVSFTTGNSFGSHSEQDHIELEWKNLDIAKANLKRIREHYEMYRSLYNYKTDNIEVLKEHKDKDWFVYDKKPFHIKHRNALDEKKLDKIPKEDWEYIPDTYTAEKCLYLLTDKNAEMQYSAFWIGHFESLESIEIVLDNEDMIYEF